MAIGYVKDSLGLAESTYISDGIKCKRGFIHTKLLEGEIRDLACIYPVGRFWEMLTSFVFNDKMQQIKKKKEIFSFLYPVEVIQKLTKDKRENELSGTWKRVFNGLETGVA